MAKQQKLTTKTKQPKAELLEKSVSLFDILNYLTYDKKSWDSLSEQAQKQVSPYMLNRFISMNSDFLPVVNEFQHYTIGLLNNREVYKLYLDILPKSKIYFKYVKGKTEDKFNKELIGYISLHLKCSNKEAIEYLELLDSKPDKNIILTEFLSKYAVPEKDIKKML